MHMIRTGRRFCWENICMMRTVIWPNGPNGAMMSGTISSVKGFILCMINPVRLPRRLSMSMTGRIALCTKKDISLVSWRKRVLPDIWRRVRPKYDIDMNWEGQRPENRRCILYPRKRLCITKRGSLYTAVIIKSRTNRNVWSGRFMMKKGKSWAGWKEKPGRVWMRHGLMTGQSQKAVCGRAWSVKMEKESRRNATYTIRIRTSGIWQASGTGIQRVIFPVFTGPSMTESCFYGKWSVLMGNYTHSGLFVIRKTVQNACPWNICRIIIPTSWFYIIMNMMKRTVWRVSICMTWRKWETFSLSGQRSREGMPG